MSDGSWTCPRCDGGFPEPFVAHGKTCCPWCGKQIGKMFSADEHQESRLREWYDVA